MNGFWAKTDSGVFQIDGTTLNLSLRQKIVSGTSQAQMPVQGSNFGRVYSVTADVLDIQYNATTPVIALWCSSNPVTLISNVQISSGLWSARIWAAAASTIEVYIFDQTPAISSGANFGMKVWNESGALIADATLPMLRPIAWYERTRSYPAGWQSGVSFPSAASEDWSNGAYPKLAVGAIKTGAYVANASSNNSNGQAADAILMISCWQMSLGGGLSYRWMQRNYGSPGSTPPYAVLFGEMLFHSCLTIDVTNL